MHDHANVCLRTEQWCHRIDTMRQPQSWLRVLLLAVHHGHIRQIRCISGRDPVCCARWDDHILILRSSSRWCPHHVDHAVDPTQSLHLDSSSHTGIWRDIGANLGESITHRVPGHS